MARQTARKSGRRPRGARAGYPVPPSSAAFSGGRLRPLGSSEVALIESRALAILERIGVAGAPGWLRERLEEKGAQVREDGRVTFLPGRVEAPLARAGGRAGQPGIGSTRTAA